MSFFANAANISESHLRRFLLPKLISQCASRSGNGIGCNVPVVVKPSSLHGVGLFSTRNLLKGEVLNLTDVDCINFRFMNDGARFPKYSAATVEEVRIFYETAMEIYCNETAEKSNVRVYFEDPESGAIQSTLVVLKDIPAGSELLRTYGIPAWITMHPTWVDDSTAYRQWVEEIFRSIFEDSTVRAQFEAMCIMANYMGLLG